MCSLKTDYMFTSNFDTTNGVVWLASHSINVAQFLRDFGIMFSVNINWLTSANRVDIFCG